MWYLFNKDDKCDCCWSPFDIKSDIYLTRKQMWLLIITIDNKSDMHWSDYKCDSYSSKFINKCDIYSTKMTNVTAICHNGWYMWC
jgi:hypothetical protein